jgi:hypothetical protein
MFHVRWMKSGSESVMICVCAGRTVQVVRTLESVDDLLVASCDI